MTKLRSDKINRIAVMGGSFNPPTIAHLRLMEAAMNAVDADKGIFVPVGEAYLKRKMRKNEDCICLKDEMRLEMLASMCADHEALSVSDIEIQNPLLYTKDTMRLLSGMYPSAKLYFIAGADKLSILAGFASKTDFFSDFSVILFSREGTDAQKMILDDERFSLCRDSFVFVRQPEGTFGVSSTAVRKLISKGEAEKAYPYLHKSVFEIFRRLTMSDFPPEISLFEGEYDFLSNKYPSPILYDGMSFTCAEAAFQATRCSLPSDKKRISQADGSRAKSIGAKIVPWEGWEDKQLNFMEEILREKFRQNSELAQKLSDTRNSILIFGVRGKNKFWGKDLYTNRGENHLGRILMKIRSEILAEKEAEDP